MNYIAMPIGSAYGWGICGKYITREMARLTNGEARLISPPFDANAAGDELEYASLLPLALNQGQLGSHMTVTPSGNRLNGALLNAIVDKTMQPIYPLRGSRTVGYTFFEENILQPAWIENARRYYDHVATGSSWCTQVLKEYGLQNVDTVIQGVDPNIFFPLSTSAAAQRDFLADRFVIFSGGKFELRKGQDLVIRAVKVLQDRHRDVVLINAWFNAWQSSFDTMKSSPHLRLPNCSGSYVDVMNQILSHNGLDMTRVVTLGPRPNALMARIYRNTDVGVFPNRCEGGTNLVLMEYMACGRPVVATATTGHADIVHSSNAMVIAAPTENTLSAPAGPVARWPEPSLDDTIEKLEYAYQHREELARLGQQAAATLAPLTWAASARGFFNLMTAPQA
jgi:glycosyltransferase involved in cell wall biosynthesis